MKIEGLSDAAIVAVGKLVGDKESSAASAKLSVGQHNVDFTIRVKGVLNRGENYTAQIVAKADFALLFAVALSHLNGTTVESIVRESLAYDPALVDSLKEIAAKAVAQIKETTTTPCNGKTTAKLVAELV